MGLTTFTYHLIDCAECESSHDVTITAQDEGEAWHEVIRVCSPEESEITEERPATAGEVADYNWRRG